MSRPTKHQISSSKAILGDLSGSDLNSVYIDCPEHKDAHKAVLYVFPHNLAGTWECPEGYTDEHDHTDYIEVIVEEEPPSPMYHVIISREIYVCSLCGVEVEGDPQLDRAEAMLDL